MFGEALSNVSFLENLPKCLFFTGTYGVSYVRRDTSTGEGTDVETTVEVVSKHSRPACFSRLKGQEREAAGVSTIVRSDRRKNRNLRFSLDGIHPKRHLNSVR